MKFVDNLQWRYATKKYDSTKKVPEEKIEYIKKAIQLSASSYGQQPYQVIEIKDPELRKRLKPVSWNQNQITDASHLFVFANKVLVTEGDVDNSIQLRADVNKIPIDKIAGYGEFVKGKLQEKSKEEMFHWTAKQAYIGLANALSACAELKVDSTPIEGFEPEAYNEILGLTEKGLNASVLLAVGYRHDEDVAQHNKKARKSVESIFQAV